MSKLVPVKIASSADIANQGSVTSPVIDTRWATLSRLDFKVTSAAGTPDLKIEYAFPAAASSTPDFTIETDLVASTAGLTSPEGEHSVQFADAAKGAAYAAVKFTGLVGNQADSVLDATLWLLEE